MNLDEKVCETMTVIEKNSFEYPVLSDENAEKIQSGVIRSVKTPDDRHDTPCYAPSVILDDGSPPEVKERITKWDFHNKTSPPISMSTSTFSSPKSQISATKLYDCNPNLSLIPSLILKHHQQEQQSQQVMCRDTNWLSEDIENEGSKN